MQQENLFSDFSPVGKAEWLDKVKADLKGRPLEELYWRLDEALRIDPFAHPEDRARVLDPPLVERRQWWVGAAAPADAALEDLVREYRQGGVRSLRLVVGQAAQLAVAAKILSEHWPELPHLVLDLPQGATAAWLESWDAPLQPAWVFGPAAPVAGLAWAGHADARAPVPSVVALLQWGASALSEMMTGQGLSADEAAPRLVFRVEIGYRYFVEIARLRAFSLLWGHVLEAYGAAPHKPVLEVHFAAEAYGDDPYHNLIRATTMAMSAVLGGADRLEVRPVALPEEGHTPFTRRMARNVQHILLLESYFDKVADPIAGSWYVEQLTDQLAEAAWKSFQQQTAC